MDWKSNFNDASHKTVWYITNEDLKLFYKCSYATAPQSQKWTQAPMIKVLSSNQPVQFAIYRIDINIYRTDNHDIFFRIDHKKTQNSEWKQVTHQTLLGYSYSNHTCKKRNGTYTWKISKQNHVYLLDSTANESNVSMSMFYDKSKQIDYYDVVINKFVMYLYKKVNEKYSPYLVFKTLNAIYELLTDAKQLNWSYTEDRPVQQFVSLLRSRIENAQGIKLHTKRQYEILISLLTVLRMVNNEQSYSVDESLKSVYEQLTATGNLINHLYKLFNSDVILMNDINHILLMERKRNLDTTSVKSYYYLLWYNAICCAHKSVEMADKSLIKAVKQQIVTSRLNWYDLLLVMTLDQRLINVSNKQFALSVLFTDQVSAHLKELKLHQRQNKVFIIIDIIMDSNDLYHILPCLDSVIDAIASDYEIWLRFASCIFKKIKSNNHDKLKCYVIHKFRGPISKILDKQTSNKLFAFYNEWKTFMKCEFIQNTILQNEYLIAEKRFIQICAPLLKYMPLTKLSNYLCFWENYFSVKELVGIFTVNGFDSKILMNYLVKSIENERNNSKKINSLWQQYKHQNEELANQTSQASNEIDELKCTMNAHKTQYIQQLSSLQNENESLKQQLRQASELKQEQQSKILVFEESLAVYKNKINKLKQQNLSLNEEINCLKIDEMEQKESDEYKKQFEIWLTKKVRMAQYLKLFIDDGCNDIRMIKFFDEQSLKQIGILNVLHRKLMIQEAGNGVHYIVDDDVDDDVDNCKVGKEGLVTHYH